jgi:hypothetical protein
MFKFESARPSPSGAEISAQLIDSFLESHEGQLKTGGLGILKHDLEAAVTQEVRKMESMEGLEEAKKLARFILDDLDYYKEFLSARDDQEIKSGARKFLTTYLSEQLLDIAA